TRLSPLPSYSATSRSASPPLRRRRTDTTCACSSTPSLHHQHRLLYRWCWLDAYGVALFVFIEHLQCLAPRSLLLVVDLAQIQNRPLHRLVAWQSPILH